MPFRQSFVRGLTFTNFEFAEMLTLLQKQDGALDFRQKYDLIKLLVPSPNSAMPANHSTYLVLLGSSLLYAFLICDLRPALLNPS